MKIVFLIFLCSMFILLISCTTSYPKGNNSNEFEQDFFNSTIIIELRGEVNFPGLYQVQSGTMLYEVVELAGGFSTLANTLDLILVMPLEENQKITIPTLFEKESPSFKKMNVNLVNENDLLQIPGIGGAKAKAIINYREEIGMFHSIEDLMKVSGIGPSLFNTIKEYLTV